MTALVQAADLVQELSSGRRPLLVDVRWSLDGPDRDGYRTGHLPGAVFCDLDADLAGPPGDRGRHPLPSAEQLTATMQRLGIDDDLDVVVYDGGNALPSARGWWCLRWAGHERVRVLDGGVPAWIGAGGLLESGDVRPTPAPGAAARLGCLPTVSAAEVASGRAGLLVDVRSGERFRGESEPIDAVAGHIPGAASLPVTKLMKDDGRLLPREQLRSVVEPLTAVTPDAPGSRSAVAAYCGSGVTAAQLVLALHELGIEAALYPGSWSEWIRDPARPVATGDA